MLRTFNIQNREFEGVLIMRETMDREKLINIAVIGAGNIATRHLENLAFLGGNRIAAICDLDELTEDPP